jgi:hypothetical protein
MGFHSFRLVASCVAVMSLAACATNNFNTNRVSSVPAPTIYATDTLAEVEIKEPISGAGCSSSFLTIFKSGDTSFLEAYGDAGSDNVSRAKAAAAYDALAGKNGLTTDFLINPVWEVKQNTQLFGLFQDDVCAKVKGYRAVIKGFTKKTDTVTGPTKGAGESPGVLSRVLKIFQ